MNKIDFVSAMGIWSFSLGVMIVYLAFVSELHPVFVVLSTAIIHFMLRKVLLDLYRYFTN